METSKKITNIILSIVLVLTIILAILSGIIRFSATNKEIYLKLLESSNTYSNVEKALSDKMISILGEDISKNLKESIITEEDIRKEADAVLDCVLSDVISGQANIPQIDTTIYKERIAKALSALTGFETKLGSDKNLTSSIQINDMCLTPINIVNSKDELIGENVFNLNENKNNGLMIINVATRAELEAKGRAILKAKGMTEEEARRKAAERGISEEDVWNYLKQNGYLDEEPQSGETGSEGLQNQESNESQNSEVQNNQTSHKPVDSSNSTNNTDSNQTINNNVQASESHNNNGNNDENKVSKKKIQEIVTSVIMDDSKNFDEKLNEISSKLMEEAEKIINAEMEKLNFSKVIASKEFNVAIKVTSALYNNFYVLLLSIVGICMLICLINKQYILNGIIMIGNSILASGVIMSIIFGGIYLSKIYTHVNINLNKAYFEPMFLKTAEYFLHLLCTCSVIILFLGFIINIFMMKRKLTRR